MKITKIKTRTGEFGSPVSTELDNVVERMRSEDTREAANRIRAIAMQSRLAMERGAARYYLKDADRLPYLMFSATFGKSGLDSPNSFNRLLLLNIPCPDGHRQVEELRRRVSQVPYTVLAFAGVSGVTLKVVVRCEYSGGATPWLSGTSSRQTLDTDRYLTFLNEAQQTAGRIYTALAMCDLMVSKPTLLRGCRMNYDPQLYYNPNALPLPVIREEGDVLKPYEGTRADDNGNVIWYPDYNERERIQMEFYTCLSKALDDAPADREQLLVTLAGYCQKARLDEEACTMRACWDMRL